MQQRWWCAALRCGFEAHADPPRPEPRRVLPSEIAAEIARATAAACTNAAFADADAEPGVDSTSEGSLSDSGESEQADCE